MIFEHILINSSYGEKYAVKVAFHHAVREADSMLMCLSHHKHEASPRCRST